MANLWSQHQINRPVYLIDLSTSAPSLLIYIMSQELTQFMFAVEYPDVATGDADGSNDCCESVTILFDAGYFKDEWGRTSYNYTDTYGKYVMLEPTHRLHTCGKNTHKLAMKRVIRHSNFDTYSYCLRHTVIDCAGVTQRDPWWCAAQRALTCSLTFSVGDELLQQWSWWSFYPQGICAWLIDRLLHHVAHFSVSQWFSLNFLPDINKPLDASSYIFMYKNKWLGNIIALCSLYSNFISLYPFVSVMLTYEYQWLLVTSRLAVHTLCIITQGQEWTESTNFIFPQKPWYDSISTNEV